MTSTEPGSATASGPELDWRPPAKGTWLQFADHFPEPVTPEYEHTFAEVFAPANVTLASRYGIPMTLEMRGINGFLYLHPAPIVAPNVSGTPPRPLMWLGVRLHPRMRACAKAAERALRERPWLAVCDAWERTERDTWFARDLALQRVAVRELGDRELSAHLQECHATWREGYARHFELHGTDQLPTAMLLARGDEWGIPRPELLATLTGWSPASLGRDETLIELQDAVADVQRSGGDVSSLEAIAAASPRAALALDAYLERHGERMITSYDLEGRTLRELPTVVLARALEVPPPGAERAREAAEHAAATVRNRVPESAHEELDRLLADARRTYGLRDDNGALLGSWPVGLTRRALLECGRRLEASGAVHDAADVFDLRIAETSALLCCRSGPRPETIAARAAQRRQRRAAVAPTRLGPAMTVPDLSVLPPAMRLLSAAQFLLGDDTGLLEDRGTDGANRDAAPVLPGSGVGTRPFTGIARVAHDVVDAIESLEPDEVLVVASTNPSWNAVLPLVGALVVEEGGALSHAAIISRELDLPAVIGAAGATSTIRTGDTVEVSPADGTVRVVSR